MHPVTETQPVTVLALLTSSSLRWPTRQARLALQWILKVVLHELGGHGILWDHVDGPNFGFCHSAGDSIAVITNDPRLQCA